MRFGVSIIGEQPIAEIVSHARLAEDLGYESFWIADSQLDFVQNLPEAISE